MYNAVIRQKLRKIKYDTELVVRVEEIDKIYDYIFGEIGELYFEFPLVVVYDLNMVELERAELVVLKEEQESHTYRIMDSLNRIIEEQKD